MPTPPALQLADVSSSPLPITLWHGEAAGGLSHHQGDPGPCRHVESRENASLEAQNHLEPAGLGSKGPRPWGARRTRAAGGSTIPCCSAELSFLTKLD